MAKKSGRVPGTKRLDTYEVARQVGNPILHRPTMQVKQWDQKIQGFGMRLKLHVMRDPNSLGLSANQIGIPWAMMAYRDTIRGQVHVLTNPLIVEMSAERVADLEGCFSVKAGMVLVTRSLRCTVHACDLRGMPVEVKPEGMAARVFQHEIDHLNGITILDHGHILTREQAESVRDEQFAAMQEAANAEARIKEEQREMAPS